MPNLTTQLRGFLTEAPFSLKVIEETLGMPPKTVWWFVKKDRSLPKKYIRPLTEYLNQYGFETHAGKVQWPDAGSAEILLDGCELVFRSIQDLDTYLENIETKPWIAALYAFRQSARACVEAMQHYQEPNTSGYEIGLEPFLSPIETSIFNKIFDLCMWVEGELKI